MPEQNQQGQPSVKELFTMFTRPTRITDPKAQRGTDRFIQSNHVYGITIQNYLPFIRSRDVSLILFYDPGEPSSSFCKPRFVKAAETTHRDNHAYGAVDCSQEPTLCALVNFQSEPLYVLYARDNMINRIYDYAEMGSDTLKRTVETAETRAGLKIEKSCY